VNGPPINTDPVDHWKEQFRFISGNVLVLGAGVVAMWHHAAMFQTGRSVHFWSIERFTEAPKMGFLWFQVLTACVAIGLSSLFFSAAYITCRAIWLGFVSSPKGASSLQLIGKWLEERADSSYSAVLIIWLFIGSMVLLLFVALLNSALEIWLRTVLPSGWFWPKMLALTLTLIPLIVVAAVVTSRLLNTITADKDKNEDDNVLSLILHGFRERFRLIVKAFIIFFVAWLFAIEMCYTVRISDTTQSVSRRENGVAQFRVQLGGATAYEEKASVELKDAADTTLQNLDLIDLGEGQYVCQISAENLVPGVYKIVLSYPRYTFSISYPFFRPTIRRSASFLVTR
jgi:hypothetical protein